MMEDLAETPPRSDAKAITGAKVSAGELTITVERDRS
jgi:hypothetical protein